MFTALAGAAGVAQMAAAVASRPVQADYFATGGIVRGTPEGTQLIAGEGNRTEAIFNPDQMANLLMAIAQGRSTGVAIPVSHLSSRICMIRKLHVMFIEGCC